MNSTDNLQPPPSVSRGQMSRATLINALHDCIAVQEKSRRRNRILNFVFLNNQFGLSAIVIGFVFAGFNIAREISGVGKWGEAFIAITFGLFGLMAAGALSNFCNRRFRYRGDSDTNTEVFLIETLKSDKPFGVYLRGFGPYPAYLEGINDRLRLPGRTRRCSRPGRPSLRFSQSWTWCLENANKRLKARNSWRTAKAIQST